MANEATITKEISQDLFFNKLAKVKNNMNKLTGQKKRPAALKVPVNVAVQAGKS